jgi:predicted O-methyltransferase YrrM
LASEQKSYYDFAYVDADKSNYSNYVDRLLNLLKPGGFIMLDNTLWRGAVAHPEKRVEDAECQALYNVINDFKNHPDLDIHSLMLADGFSVIRKKK